MVNLCFSIFFCHCHLTYRVKEFSISNKFVTAVPFRCRKEPDCQRRSLLPVRSITPQNNKSSKRPSRSNSDSRYYRSRDKLRQQPADIFDSSLGRNVVDDFCIRSNNNSYNDNYDVPHPHHPSLSKSPSLGVGPSHSDTCLSTYSGAAGEERVEQDHELLSGAADGYANLRGCFSLQNDLDILTSAEISRFIGNNLSDRIDLVLDDDDDSDLFFYPSNDQIVIEEQQLKAKESSKFVLPMSSLFHMVVSYLASHCRFTLYHSAVSFS